MKNSGYRDLFFFRSFIAYRAYKLEYKRISCSETLLKIHVARTHRHGFKWMNKWNYPRAALRLYWSNFIHCNLSSFGRLCCQETFPYSTSVTIFLKQNWRNFISTKQNHKPHKQALHGHKSKSNRKWKCSIGSLPTRGKRHQLRHKFAVDSNENRFWDHSNALQRDFLFSCCLIVRKFIHQPA